MRARRTGMLGLLPSPGLGVLLALAAAACGAPPRPPQGVAPAAAAPAGARPTSIARPAGGAPPAAATAVRPVTFRFAPGDTVETAVWREPELKTEQQVMPDGTISLMLVGTFPLAGLSPEEARGRLTARYAEYLRDPQVAVRPVAIHARRVIVLGEVDEPVVVPFTGPLTLLEAVAKAKGFLEEYAEKSQVRLVRLGPDGRPNISVVRADLILAGRMPDVPLAPGDVVFVPARGVTDWFRTAGQALAPLGTAIGTLGSAAAIVDLARN